MHERFGIRVRNPELHGRDVQQHRAVLKVERFDLGSAERRRRRREG
jgi:hypothetical protein